MTRPIGIITINLIQLYSSHQTDVESVLKSKYSGLLTQKQNTIYVYSYGNKATSSFLFERVSF